VNWLRAKAQHTRWEEELMIVQKEMEWTCNTFQSLQQIWTSRANVYKDNKKMQGHWSYAVKQGIMWRDWNEQAKVSFSKILALPQSKILALKNKV
jgi:hypothetical protein